MQESFDFKILLGVLCSPENWDFPSSEQNLIATSVKSSSRLSCQERMASQSDRPDCYVERAGKIRAGQGAAVAVHVRHVAFFRFRIAEGQSCSETRRSFGHFASSAWLVCY